MFLIMDNIQFFAVVAKMRQVQKKYFGLSANHPEKGEWLKESKRLEQIIDREIARVISSVDGDRLREAYKPFDKFYATQPTLGI